MLVVTPESRAVLTPIRVPVVCGLGAGEAFGGSLCHGLLSGWDPVEIVTRANAAGAIVAGRLMCCDEMPTPAEIDHLLATAPRFGLRIVQRPTGEDVSAAGPRQAAAAAS